jgi:mRNA-degrading endonuclease RelE of RelBE toxin-antitoxin system
MHKIFYSRQAQKFLLSQENKLAKLMREKILMLPTGDVKRLAGKTVPPLYRLRIGKIRVVYCRDGENIKIIKIDYRGDVYK